MKNWLRKGILYGTALTLAGCSVDIGRAVNPEFGHKESFNISYAQNADNFEARKNRLLGRNSLLEAKINDSLDNMKNRGNGVGKLSTAVETFDYDAFVGDLDLDHDVDFDDFFLLADDFGLKYDFDHFFTLADNFGKSVNKRPLITNVDYVKGPNVGVNEEAVLKAHAVDAESDPLDYHWLVDGRPSEANGTEFRWKTDDEGSYEIGVKVSDRPYNTESALIMSLPLVVEQIDPVLNLPDEIKFDQYVNGAVEGNTYKLNLDDFVSDGKFRDSELTWSFDDSTSVENNKFIHETTFSYETKALHLEPDGNRNLEINPVANYNASDHGDRYVNFTVNNPDGKTVNKRIKVNVVRNAYFDDLYDYTVTGGGWIEPPKYFYIWTGKGISENEEWPLSAGVGPEITQEEIDYFRQIAELIPTVSDFFKPVEIILTNNNDDVIGLTNETAKDVVYSFIDNSTFTGGQSFQWDYDIFNHVVVGINSMSKNESMKTRFFPISLHEMFGHNMGMDHPPEYYMDQTIFYPTYTLTYIPERDKAIIDSFYETRQYGYKPVY